MNEKLEIKTTVYSALVNNSKSWSKFKEQAEKLKYKV
jgi:hypothetical protein